MMKTNVLNLFLMKYEIAVRLIDIVRSFLIYVPN